MSRWLPIIVNVVSFDALWTLTVCGAGKPWWWAGPTMIMISGGAQLRWSPAPRSEAAIILIGAAAGVTFDIASNAIGLFHHAWGSWPQFVIAFLSLWMNFGTTLRPSLRWMWRRPAIGAVLGAVGGPLAYWTAARLGAITPAEPEWRAFAWCAMQYALAVPLWSAAASLVFNDARAPVHQQSSSEPRQSPGTPPS